MVHEGLEDKFAHAAMPWLEQKGAEAWFKGMDKDNLGYLTYRQVQQGLTEWGYSEYEVECLCLMMDSNLDDKISLGEFVGGFNDLQAHMVKGADGKSEAQVISKQVKQAASRRFPPPMTPTPAHRAKPNLEKIWQGKEQVLRKGWADVKEEFEFGDELGRGAFGIVYRVKNKRTNEQFACKGINKKELKSVEEITDLVKELQMCHTVVGHENILPMHASFEDKETVWLILELCEGGELFDRIIDRGGHYCEADAASIIKAMLSVIAHCHSLGVVHRDLKPENFVFKSKDENAEIKLIDFGLSAFFKPKESLDELVGTPLYWAPEVFLQDYNKEVDTWAIGVIMYVLLCGEYPFYDEDDAQLARLVCKAEVTFDQDIWKSVSDGAKSCIKRLLHVDPKKRPLPEEILEEGWLNGDAPTNPLENTVVHRIKKFSTLGQAKKLIMKDLVHMLSEEELSGLKSLFASYDLNHDKRITMEELKRGLNESGANMPPEEIQKIMDAADADGTGFVDFEEFTASLMHKAKLCKEENMRRAFNEADTDGSGKISEDELRACLERMGVHGEDLDRDVKEFLTDCDEDHDGKIDYSEFLMAIRRGAKQSGDAFNDG
jgi:calcium-dependent protein kinase